MNIGLWFGFLVAAGLLWWGAATSNSASALVNSHGVLVVIGGTAAATLISTPPRVLASAFVRMAALFMPNRLPSPEQAAAEMVRIARLAQTGGGLLSVQNEGRDMAEGFVHRALTVAIAAGETSETRRILEKEIRQLRIGRQEDANVFRTIGTLSPMFGILGTLLGMIQVLQSFSEPTKLGPAMALALSSAFMGIAIANFLCIPVAGMIRLASMAETLVLEVLMEGVLDIAAGKAPYLVELHLASYSRQRREELAAQEAAPARVAAGRA